MLVYNLLLIINILVGLILLYGPFVKEKLGEKLYLLFTLIELLILGGFRSHNIGTDTSAYVTLFYTIKVANIKELLQLKYELGYLILNKVIALLGGNAQTLLIVKSLIISFGFVYFIKANSINYLLSAFLLITLYYYYASFNAIRQYIAIVIFINSFIFIKKKKFLYFLFMIILASLFHLTTILFLPVYFLGSINWSIRKIIIFVILLFLIYLNLETFVYLMIKIFPQYETYLGTDYLKGYTGKMYIIVNLTIFLFLLVVYIAKGGYKYQDINILLVFDILIVALNLFSTKIYFANRLSWFFTPFHIIIIPKFLSLINESRIREIALSLIIIMGIVYHTYCLGVNLHRINPYTFYWEYQDTNV